MTSCATAACHQQATAVVDGWPMCPAHARPEPQSRPERPWHAYKVLRQWIELLHHVGLNDPQIAGLCGVSPTTVRFHRRRLGLPVNRTDKQRARDNRLLIEADRQVSRCACTDWQWNGHCSRCARKASAA